MTNARGFRKNPHLDRYVQRRMKGVFDLLIADEVHELAAAESIQGNTFGTLAAACRYTIALTGTLIGGKASDLHAPLWRMSPDLLKQRGFDLRAYRGSRISAIARNERALHRDSAYLSTKSFAVLQMTLQARSSGVPAVGASLTRPMNARAPESVQTYTIFSCFKMRRSCLSTSLAQRCLHWNVFWCPAQCPRP